MARFTRILGIITWVLLFALPAAAQRDRGELQIEVRDSQGAVLSASGELVSEGNQFHLDFSVGDDGRFAAQGLAFGVYRVSVSRSGFVPTVQLVEIRSMVPQHLSLTLGLKPVETQMQVSETETLVDTTRTSAVYTIGSQTIGEQLSSQAGRGVLDVVDAQPGWLQEANGVLHPRGSEYDVQFVVDGLPMTENRSPGFAPPIESSDVESLRVMTAGFPAEYGRKLGGVVEVTSPKNNPMGLHGEFEAKAAVSHRPREAVLSSIPMEETDFPLPVRDFIPAGTSTRRFSRTIQISETPADFHPPTSAIFQMATVFLSPSRSTQFAIRFRTSSSSRRQDSARTPSKRKRPARSITRTHFHRMSS